MITRATALLLLVGPLAFPPALVLGANLPPESELRARAVSPHVEQGAHIPLVDGSLQIDGRLDEPFWENALVWSLPFEIEIGENAEAPVETFVLLAATREALRVAFVSLDPDPSRIRATFTDRDRWDRSTDDSVGLFLDTFGNGRNAYYVMVNARGVQFDALRLDRGGQGVNDDVSVDFLGRRQAARRPAATSWSWSCRSDTCVCRRGTAKRRNGA